MRKSDRTTVEDNTPHTGGGPEGLTGNSIKSTISCYGEQRHLGGRHEIPRLALHTVSKSTLAFLAEDSGAHRIWDKSVQLLAQALRR